MRLRVVLIQRRVATTFRKQFTELRPFNMLRSAIALQHTLHPPHSVYPTGVYSVKPHCLDLTPFRSGTERLLEPCHW